MVFPIKWIGWMMIVAGIAILVEGQIAGGLFLTAVGAAASYFLYFRK